MFKTTYNILHVPDEDELFNENHFDLEQEYIPPTKEWDYKRPLEVEDVDVWEVLYEAGQGFGVYASWTPHAEFYMVTAGLVPNSREGRYVDARKVETYYGPGVQSQVIKRAKELGMNLSSSTIWVDDDDLWQYQLPSST